jgi:hypothetical protein
VDWKVGRRLAGCRMWGKLASRRTARHHPPMRRYVPLAVVIALAACAPRVATSVEPASTPTTSVRPTGALFGVSASDLIARFGQPTFQVREGVGTKLQWSRNGCVFDAYLYPPPNAQGVPRVSHVDTRRTSGDNIPLDTCLALMGR